MIDEQKNDNVALNELAQDTAPEQVEASSQDQPRDNVATQAEINFKAIRSEKERVERENERLLRERDDAIRYAREYEMRLQQQYPPQQQQVDEFDQLKPDDLVEVKHVQNKMRQMEAKMAQMEQKNQIGMIESQLKSKYSDFEDVVSQSNLNALKEAHPDIYKTIYTSNDLYSKGSAAYQLIKQFVKAPEENNYSEERSKVVANAARPRNINTLKPQQSTGALDNASLYAKGKAEMDRKKQVYDHMQNFAAPGSIKFTEIK
jgi:hypothetical protein